MNVSPTLGSVFVTAAQPSVWLPIRIGLAGAPDRFARGLSRALSARGVEVGALGTDEHVAILQHDFRFQPHADAVFGLLDVTSAPSVVVVHSVPKSPTAQQRSAVECIAARANHLVVMSDAAARHLAAAYSVDRRDVTTIPHGARVSAAPRLKRPSRPTILTWGWLAPGDGIERVIEVMGSLANLPGRPRYLVAGPTHPDVLQADGESYRESLVERVRALGLTGSVAFDAGGHTGALSTLFQQASIVVLPYDSVDQVCAPVLVEAIAKGRPVVATAFPHAVELLSGGAGTVVRHDDADGLASALRSILTQPRLAGAMAGEARRVAPDLDWNVVAAAYDGLAHGVLARNMMRQ